MKCGIFYWGWVLQMVVKFVLLNFLIVSCNQRVSVSLSLQWIWKNETEEEKKNKHW